MLTPNNCNIHLTLCTGIAMAGLLLPMHLFAGTDSKEAQMVEQVNQSAITGDLGVNFVSQHVSRGKINENQGVIAQPYADLFLPLFEGNGVIDKITLDLGLWSSLTSRHTGAVPDNTVKVWNEFDYLPGISVTVVKNLIFTTSYYEFDSPNGAFGPSRNVNLALDYNDADLLGAFALHPHLVFLKELSGKANNGPADKKGEYYEVGVTPGLPPFGPVFVTFPLTAGFGSAGFYAGDENSEFGYFSAGPNVAVALPFIPARLGKWTANLGASYYYLHGSLSTANAIRPSNNNDWVFNGGVGMTF